ncbi:MAG TPA: hypothetical protein DCL38_09000 [Lachnospiraceae bacterium]|nr:hypothetical protein [Lachnospiraceae bacterium]
MKERRDVTRTKNAIEHAYLELLFRKGYSRVTVNEVIDLADVSRGTFYAHYRDISDLEEKVEDKAVKALREACETDEAFDIEMIARTRLGCVFDLFYSFRDDFKLLLLADNNTKMINKVRTVLVEAMEHSSTMDLMTQRIGRVKASLILESIAGCFVAGFINLMKNENEINRDVAVELMSDLISGGLERVIEEFGIKEEK